MKLLCDKWTGEPGHRLLVYKKENNDLLFQIVEGRNEEEIGFFTLSEYRAEDLTDILVREYGVKGSSDS